MLGNFKYIVIKYVFLKSYFMTAFVNIYKSDTIFKTIEASEWNMINMSKIMRLSLIQDIFLKQSRDNY